VFCDPGILGYLATWIHQHLQDTAHDKNHWQAKYLQDQRFFTELAALAHCILDCHDLFDTAAPALLLVQQICPSFYKALTELCLRIVSFIPRILEESFTRRDSVQPTATGQGIPLSTYIPLLSKILNDRTPFSTLLHRSFGIKSPLNVARNAKLLLGQPPTIAALNKTLLNLSVQPRSFTDAWPIIADVISILAVAFRCADIEFHARVGCGPVDDMFMTINEYIVPAICQKHPRALPTNFHDNLIHQMSVVLENSVTHRPMSAVLDIYNAITRVDHALPSGIVDEPATEAKLNEACCDDRKVLAELLRDLWLLQVLKGYVSTDILDIKSKGILSLRVLLKESYNAHHKNGGDDHTVLQYLARFLRIGNFTEYIFSADSHASLVKECSDIVGFLAAIGTYTDHETELIWQACTTSVEAEFVKASFEVLRYILQYVRQPQILHMARKYSQTPASALGPFAVQFLSEAFMKLHGSDQYAGVSLEPMRISFDIVKRLDLDPPAPSTPALRLAAVTEISLLAGPTYGVDDRKVLYDLCFGEIKARTKHTTSSMETLMLFLKSPRAEEVDLILDLFPVRAAVDELEHFVSNDTKGEENGARSTLEAVKIRLELVLYLVGLSEFPEDKELEERLWVCTIGDAAISSQAREDALDSFISIPRLTKNPPSVEQLFHRSVDQFLPTMSADCATLRLVAFLQSKVKEAESAAAPDNIGRILEDQSWQQLTRLATTTSSDNVATAGVSAISDILFPKHLARDNPQVMARQAAFVRNHIDFLQSLQREEDLPVRQVSIDRGITLLETVYHHSKAFRPQVIGDSLPIDLTGNDEADRIEFTVHIHGPQGSPIARTVQALEDCHIVDLGKALQSTSGVTDHDLVLNGSLSRIEDVSGQTLHEAGIRASSVVSIRPRYTFDCDFGKVFAPTTPVEGEIRENFGHLESLLDGPEAVAERVSCIYRTALLYSPMTISNASQVYNFLSEVSPPMSTRRHVLSREVLLEEIFPRTRPWRTLYSIHVLSSHLHECNKLGVADQAFILHGAKVLSDLLLDTSRPTSGIILLKCLPSLVGFLQGEIKQPKMTTGLRVANSPTERPQDSPPPPYVEESKKLGLRLFEIIGQIESITSAISQAPSQPVVLSARAELMRLAYSVILQLARTDGLWPEIDHSSGFVRAHQTLLLNQDVSVSQTMSAVMADFAKERPDLATRSYLDALVALLPDAMSKRCSTTGYFTLFREILVVDRRANDNDESIRSIIEKLVQQVWLFRHTETADCAVMDPTMFNLLSVLSCAMDVLKSFKQPLALGSLAREIFSRLLFCDGPNSDEIDTAKGADEPPKASLALRASSTRIKTNNVLPEPGQDNFDRPVYGHDKPVPLYHPSTRAICMDIVRKLCDNASDFTWLMDRVASVTQHVTPWLAGTFPSGHFIRAPDASPGLTNLGMTCYMNSLLQQIYSNVQFRKFIFDTPVANSSEPDLLWHVKRLFAEMQDSNVPCVDTQALTKYLNISVDTQEDVHGFFTIFMSALEQCLPSSAATATFNGMFSGKLVTQVQGSCGHVSSRTEPFSDLSITVQNKLSLADSLDEFVQGEPMQGANKYKCLSCDAESGGKLVDAMRRTCLDSVPDHLTVCLKRFTFDMMGQESKNNDLFQFPEEIDLAEYKRESLENTSEPIQPDVFNLVGVIVHSGILNFGHYWSYVRLRHPDHRISRWARLEDSMYRPAKGFDEVRNECFGGNNSAHNGYVLFYQRESAFQAAASAILPQDAHLGLGMPPRVQIPNDLYREIHQQNVERHCTAQPFDDSFHRIVVEIVQEFRSRCEPSDLEDCPSPQSPDATSTGDDQLASSTKAEPYLTVARLALNYITRVLFSEKVPQKVNHLVFVLKNQAVVDTKLARCFISEVCSNPEVLLRFIDHDEPDPRNNMKILLRDCLASLKDNDQDNYLGLLVQFVTAHASLLPQMGPRYGRWYDYFSMPFEVKLFGADEASIVLDAGYVSWILETAVAAPVYPAAHPEEQPLILAVRKGKVSYLPLFHFVQLFLMQSGAFEAPDCFDEFGHDGKFRAAQALVAPRGPTLEWVTVASMADCEESSWEKFPPAVLLHAMTNSPDTRYRPLLCLSLCACFQHNQHYKPALYLLATAFILACGDNAQDLAYTVLGALITGIKQFERMPCRAGLEVFSAVYPAAPLSVLRTVGDWAPEWLLPENRNSRRTLNWLQWNIFGDDALHKVSDGPEVWGTAVDVARSRGVRELYLRCRGLLSNAHDIEEGATYANMQAALSDADTYLGNLITMCNQIRLQARRALEEHAEMMVEHEAAGVSAPDLADVPGLTLQMDEEYHAAARVRQDLHRLLQQLSSWDDEQEPIEEEGDSSAFEDTEEDDYE